MCVPLLTAALAAVAFQNPDSSPAASLAWPEYRGPDRNGSAAGAPPLTWNEEENVRWKVPVHGRGWSSPVVLEGRIWLTTATSDGTELSVLAFDYETGATLVDRVVFGVEDPRPRNALNSYASPSPVVAPGRVWVHFGTYGTACIDAASGESLWERRDFACDHMEGPGSSPLLEGGRLYFHNDGADVQYIVALDAATGETVWKTGRSADLERLEGERRKAYSTPVPVRVGETLQLVSSGAEASYGYDAATGVELWRVLHEGFSMSSRPIVDGARVFLSTGFMRSQLLAIRLDGKGDVTGTHVDWTATRSVPTMPSPVIADGRLFQVSDKGMASCIDLASGETLWQERLGAEHCASPVVVNGRVYYFDREGKTTVIRPGPEFVKLAESKLSEGFMASAAVVGDAFILRTEGHLYRIEAPAR